MKNTQLLFLFTLSRQAFGSLLLLGLIAGCLLPASSVWAQSQTITGQVTALDTEETLPGVNIVVKGTTEGTITDLDGNYRLTVPQGADTLVFSSVGYTPEEVAIGNRTTIDMGMAPDIQNLSEVVVVGYGTQTKETITGAIGNITSEDLTKTPAVTTSGALVGRIQGITARQGDARPGGSTSLQIRNLGEPLFVIDGIPSDAGQFNNLGPNDIESISILKDGSAAIYGLRAANGVVLVTTKRGKAGEKAKINLSGYYGLQNFTRYPRPANAYQYLRARVESEVNLGRPAPADIPATELEKWRLGTEPGYQSFDYYDFVITPNVPQYYLNGNASGGSENATYFVSVSHLNQDAMIEDYNFNRTNFQSNIEVTLTDGLRIGTQLSGRIEDRHQVGVPGLDDYFNPFLSIFSMWPTERPYANDNPNYVNTTHNVNVNPATYTEDITGYIDDTWRAVKGNFYAQYDFDFGLSLKGTYSYSFANLDFDGFEYTYNTFTYNEDTDSYDITGGNQNPWRERRREDLIDRVGQFQASYNKRFGEHSISAVLGFERIDHQRHRQVVHTVPPNNYIPIMSFNDQDLLIDELNEEARQGYIGRVNYTYKDKYLLELLGRYDGSFLFPKENRYGFFPGVSVGWRMTEENFMQNVNFLSELKLRASYSYIGNERLFQDNAFVIAPYSYYAGYEFIPTAGGGAILDGQLIPGVDPRNPPITNFSWIDNITTNIGIDIGLFDGKLFGQFDIFERRREGLPAGRYDVRLPDEVGYPLPAENLETDAHRGIEGALTYSGKINDQILFKIGGNATLSRWRFLDRYKPRYGNSWDEYRTAAEDRWAWIQWGYEVVGQFESQEEIDNYAINNDLQGNRTQLPGDFKFKDVNGDGIINNMDERPIGYGLGRNPYLSFGLNGEVSYKGFSLSFNFAGAALQSYNRNWELRYPFPNNGTSPDYLFEDNWRRVDPYNPDSEWVSGTYPAIRNDWGHPNYSRSSTFWMVNIRYMRLRNLEIGYNLPRSILDRIGIDNLRVYANGTNLFSIDNTKQYGIDPEIVPENALVYPQQRLFNFGFNLTL